MKKMLNRFFLPLLGLLFAGTLSVAAASDVKAPDALVKDVTNEVLEIVRADKAIQAGDTHRVIELVDAKVLPHFDFRRMTMLAVGRDWRQASPEQQGKLTDALLDLSAETRMVVMGQAAQRLADAGFSTHIVIESGDVAQVLGRHLTIQQLPLLVMSAFTHNGWRQKLLGTTTSTLLRRIPTSVLVLR